MTDQATASWYPDPLGRHEHRYWDGGQWTHHVASRGLQAIDPPVPGSPSAAQTPQAQLDSQPKNDAYASGSQVPTLNRASKRVERQVRKLGVTEGAQDGHEALFTEPVLVFNQKGKLFEVNAEYTVFDRQGEQIGAVREVGQSILKKAATPSNRTRRLQVLDTNGRVLITLIQPTKFIKSKMIVIGANGTQIGQIVQKLTVKHFSFRLESGGQSLGSISGENRRQSDFSIQDATGNEVGRITRTTAGLAKEMFTKADNYVVEIHSPLAEPLRSLLIAAALAVDTALRQR